MKLEILHWHYNENVLIILSQGLKLHKAIMRCIESSAKQTHELSCNAL